MHENPTYELDPGPSGALPEQKQRRRMLGALALLLVALILVLAKDWDFWFPPQSADIETTQQNPPRRAAAHIATPQSTPPAITHKIAKNHHVAPAVQVASASPAPVVTTNRAVLPPLEIQVVAGNQPRPVPAGNSSVRIDLQAPDGSRSAAPVQNAAERVTLSPATADMVSRSVDPSYPLLAKQMKVQGSVVLQAIIGSTGNIEDLRVVSGPSILSDAARQAVKQWRFKPYYQAGQAVETEARITVNFTISTY